MDNDTKHLIEERLQLGGVKMTTDEFYHYIKMRDDLGIREDDALIPPGFKRCGKCRHILKFHLFNKNNAAKTGCTGTCKECQKKAAKRSYRNTKRRRNYKKRYESNKEEMREKARLRYSENKETILEQQKEYRKTKAGRKVMSKAHQKRYTAIKENSGIPYERHQIIERDSLFIGEEYPICNICGKAITDVSGEGLHLDHVVPIVMGGKDCFTNVACVHASCNLTKTKDARDSDKEEIDRIIERSQEFFEYYPELLELI